MTGTPTEYDDALHMMEKQGGSFVRSLAACYYAADPSNKRRLREAFAGYFDKYEERWRSHVAFLASRKGATK